MRLIIDTNLLFSSISKKDGKIAEIILNPNFDLKLIGCYYSYIELFKHKNKLLKASKLTEVEMLEVMYQVLKKIDFINEGSISSDIFTDAWNLTKDVDEKDTVLSMYLKSKIWSGDKELVDGLRKKGFTEIIMTHELIEILNKNQ